MHFAKSHEPYKQGSYEDYYLEQRMKAALANKTDSLGIALLETECTVKASTSKLCEPTWAAVEKAVPVMRKSAPHGRNCGGLRTFVGSRGTSVDGGLSDHAEDCSDNDYPSVQSFVMNLTAIADGEAPILDFASYLNFSYVADGMVGESDGLSVIYYFPILSNSTPSRGAGSRYWTMIASPVADMEGGSEASVWFRFQQLQREGEHGAGPCKLKGKPQYWDTYWYSHSPITKRFVPPDKEADASGFYSNLLANRQYWRETYETMSELPALASTNGSWLWTQAKHALWRSMISRDNTWNPRYGIVPGYGISLQDGFQDTHCSTVTAALELGAIPYAKGVIDNWLKFYVRDNGAVTYRAEEVALSGRTLTLLALYNSYTGDDELLLSHFGKAQVLAEWLLYRRNQSL